jgi:polyisoprenoid-binding protein YceI
MLALVWTMSGLGQRFSTNSGYVHFLSDAPLERIEAESDELQGILDTETNEFAFSLSIRSFRGFNSGLQREHFNENYMKSEQHPRGTFTGKIVEDIDFSTPDTHQVRAKGKMTIHGISQERIIKASLIVGEESIMIEADFAVLLSDHQISIPRIVRQKISEEIEVQVRTTLRP